MPQTIRITLTDSQAAGLQNGLRATALTRKEAHALRERVGALQKQAAILQQTVRALEAEDERGRSELYAGIGRDHGVSVPVDAKVVRAEGQPVVMEWQAPAPAPAPAPDEKATKAAKKAPRRRRTAKK